VRGWRTSDVSVDVKEINQTAIRRRLHRQQQQEERIQLLEFERNVSYSVTFLFGTAARKAANSKDAKFL
jgi:hypothetical protein